MLASLSTRTTLSISLVLTGLTAPTALAQTSPATDCASTPLVPTTVLLTWPDVPTEDTVAAMPSPQVSLRVDNQGTSNLDYVLVGHVHAGGSRVELELASGSLAAGSLQTIALGLDAFGIDISDLAFSGSLFVESRATEAGVLVDRAYSPSLFFHQDQDVTGAVTTWIYGRGARKQYFNSGDLLYQVLSSTSPRHVLGVFDGGAGVGWEGEDHGPSRSGNGRIRAKPPVLANNQPWEFCMRWVYQSIDSGFGEDHYQQGHLMKARGMKVQIDHPNWPQPRLAYANDDNGCIMFYAQENTGFIVTVYAEAHLGLDGNDPGKDGDIIVRTFDTVTQADDNDPDDVPVWIFAANPGGQPRRVYYQNEASTESTLMAHGSFAFHWVDSHTQPRLAGPLDLQLVTDGTGCDGSCQSMYQVRVQPGAEQRKFLVGHEVGHWMHRWWSGNQLGLYQNAYSANSGNAPCSFAGVGSHAMRSKEYAAGAFVEGFAHFLSALAWNDHTEQDGWFRYYKEIQSASYADMAANQWRVDLEGDGLNPVGGISSWMANMCSVHDGHSVEMDWLRFYWDYRTNGGNFDKPTHHDLFEHIRYTQDNMAWPNNLTAYDSLRQAIGDPALAQTLFEDRWVQLAIMNGVAQ